MYKLSFLLLAIIPAVLVNGQDAACNSAGGLCVSRSQCAGATRSGLCPSFGADILCCVDSQCTSAGGRCIDTTKTSCGGSLRSGLCPSFGASVRCCVPNANPPPAPATPRPATPAPNPPAPAPAGTVKYVPSFRGPSSSTVNCTTPISGRRGACISISSCSGANFNNLCSGSAKCCVADLTEVTYRPLIPRNVFDAAFSGISGFRATAMYAHLMSALATGNINTCLCRAAFMAQVSHESGGLLYFEEIASGSAYEGRRDLGNTQPGDGVRYKGRGPIQLTGRANYRSTGSRIGLPLEADPELVCMPSVGFRTTVDYWNNNGLSQFCQNGGDAEFVTMTRRINGGTNGLDDRRARYARYRSLMGC